MRSKLILAVSLAVLAMPIVAHAEMAGDTCPLTSVGSSKLADDEKNIIACLKTSDTTAEWKALTSGGGGVTGGCVTNSFNFLVGIWGKGCQGNKITYGRFGDEQAELRETASGYSCGLTSQETKGENFSGDDQRYFYSCVKE